MEKEIMDHVETESIRFRPGGKGDIGGKYSQRGPIKDIFVSMACSRSILSRKRSDSNLYEQSSSREIL
jgi:hypothetical protein